MMLNENGLRITKTRNVVLDQIIKYIVDCGKLELG